MATHKSALKRIRRNASRRTINRRNLSRMRTAVKTLRGAIEARDAKTASPLLRSTLSLIDRMVSKGVLHANAAARTKSRLTRHLRRLESGAGAAR
jgi:small subunit ribosomal protein S20